MEKDINKTNVYNNLIPVHLDDVMLKIEPDSGAEVNLMDEHQYDAFQHRTKTELELLPSKVKLKTLQGKLDVKAEFKATLRNKTKGMKTKFIVVKGRLDSPPLLSRSTLLDMGMIKIQPDGAFADKNMRMKKIDHEKKIEKIIREQKHVFKGI